MNKQILQEYQRCQGEKQGVFVANGHYFYLYGQLHLFMELLTQLYLQSESIGQFMKGGG